MLDYKLNVPVTGKMYLIREKRNTRSIGCSAWPRTSTERMCLYTHASRTPNSEKKVFFGKTNYTQRNDFKYILFSSCVLLFLVTFRVWKKQICIFFASKKESADRKKYYCYDLQMHEAIEIRKTKNNNAFCVRRRKNRIKTTHTHKHDFCYNSIRTTRV